MMRHIAVIAVLALTPGYASAQQCTSDVEAVVNETYLQIIERPRVNEGEVWTQLLQKGGTVRELVRQIAQSGEYAELVKRGSTAAARERTVESVYEHLLGRVPNRSTLRSQAGLIQNGNLAALVDQIVSSPEYTELNGDWRVPGSNVRYCGNTGGSGWVARTRGITGGSTQFEQADRNRDGRITVSEWDDTRQAFIDADRNRDNVLTRDEYLAAMDGGNAAVGTSGSRESEFDDMDRNRNNRVERGEWRGSDETFRWLDRNGNGWLSRGEVVGNQRIQPER